MESRTFRKLQISFLHKVKFDSTQVIQKYSLFLLNFDHLCYTVFFQCQKVEMIKNWLNSIISNHECANNPIISVQKSLIGWKNMFIFCRSFRFFWGIQIYAVLLQKQDPLKHFMCKFTLYYFKSDMNTF